jgi:hypothetical protein
MSFSIPASTLSVISGPQHGTSPGGAVPVGVSFGGGVFSVVVGGTFGFFDRLQSRNPSAPTINSATRIPTQSRLPFNDEAGSATTPVVDSDVTDVLVEPVVTEELVVVVVVAELDWTTVNVSHPLSVGLFFASPP